MPNIDIRLGNTMGISRKLDLGGRAVIPMEFRKELDLCGENPWVEMFLVSDGVYIRKKKFKYKGEK